MQKTVWLQKNQAYVIVMLRYLLPYSVIRKKLKDFY